MQSFHVEILQDDWTPLFATLEKKVSATGRSRLLSVMISDVYEVTYANFGTSGQARPAEWSDLKMQYAADYHDGDTTPTLILNGALRDGFVHEVTEAYATLTNIVDYADKHQFGEGRMYRPYYPVTKDGESFTPYMEQRLAAIVEKHFTI
jgi:phage gpG-like protein